ncbi:hypothetical protein FGO68_gene15201 [Halteria grandinella]|uniref:Glutamine cyclotransferase n=1 Tax=Halteria grandinella TaxID=5974 RepID=A0A8J8NK44_HALGN|nr:hypothetical protein FGO68_gene15201 [Halteria grandinella]
MLSVGTWIYIGAAIASLVILTVVLTITGGNSSNVTPGGGTLVGAHNIVKTYRVDDRYFYQGLEFVQGSTNQLLMGEGWWGKSNLALMEIDEEAKSISRVASYPINSAYFGEGVTYFPADSRIYQLTWKDGVLVVYENLQDPTKLKEIPLPSQIGEGWGLTHDADYIYISNGSTKVYVVVPNSTGLSIQRVISANVGYRTPMFNEIELVGDYIYANAYTTNDIYKFSKIDGTLVKIYNFADLANLQKKEVQSLGQSYSYDWGNNVLNGIAYRQETNTFLLTGKKWDFMFEVALTD